MSFYSRSNVSSLLIILGFASDFVVGANAPIAGNVNSAQVNFLRKIQDDKDKRDRSYLYQIKNAIYDDIWNENVKALFYENLCNRDLFQEADWSRLQAELDHESFRNRINYYRSKILQRALKDNRLEKTQVGLDACIADYRRDAQLKAEKEVPIAISRKIALINQRS